MEEIQGLDAHSLTVVALWSGIVIDRNCGDKRMEERFHTSLILPDSPPLQPVLLTYRLCQIVPVSERDGVALISHVGEQLHGLRQRTNGYCDIGLSTEPPPAIVVRMIGLEPGAWNPSSGTDDLRAPLQAEVVDDQLLRLLLPVKSMEGNLSTDTVEEARRSLRELADGWEETDLDYERILEAVEHSGSETSELERTTAGLLEELDRRTELMQTHRDSGSTDRQQRTEGDEESVLFRQLRHDLPAPLSTIHDTIDRLRERDLSDEQEEHVKQLRQTSERVVQLVTDAVDLSRIQSGSFAISREPVRITAFLDDCLSMFQDRDAEQVELRYDISQVVPRTVRFDADRVRQVLVHVVENALEHTTDGRVTIRVDMREEENDDTHVVWEVEDTGTGIPEHEQEWVFDAFYQGDTAREREGTGLGLTIVDRLVDAMNGWVDVRSTPGEGTVFRFGLPVDTAGTEEHRGSDEPEEVSADSLSLEDKRLLVATDDATTMNTMKQILQSLNASVSTVDHVMEVDDHFRLFPEGKPEFDAIFLNPHMSGLNGFELLETLHRHRSMDHVVPIASSAFEKKNRHYAASYGIQYFLSRPVSRQHVLEVVGSLFDLDEDQRPDEEERETSDPFADLDTPVQLLLAEDNDLNREFMRKLLESYPIDITMATTGREALEMYRDRANEFDLVFMDLKMPDLNGIEATRKIRTLEKEEARAHTPIIALTAETRGDRLERSLEAGCNAHVSKPVDVDRVLDIIRDQLVGA